MGSAIDGSYAEMVAVPAVNAHAIDETVSYVEAAAIPTHLLAGLEYVDATVCNSSLGDSLGAVRFRRRGHRRYSSG